MPRIYWGSEGGGRFLMGEVPFYAPGAESGRDLKDRLGTCATGVPRSKENTFPWEPAVGLCVGT